MGAGGCTKTKRWGRQDGAQLQLGMRKREEMVKAGVGSKGGLVDSPQSRSKERVHNRDDV